MNFKEPTKPIVTVDWLMESMDRDDIQIIDTSMDMTRSGIPPHDVFLSGHIPNAIHMDLFKVAAPSTKPPHRMVPEPELFASLVGQLGIREDATLVFYDNFGLYTAARGWWMFKGFGHRKSYVLEGGLPAWKRKGGEVESGFEKKYPVQRWTVPTSRPRVRDWKQVLDNITTKTEQVVDARSPDMFNGDTGFRYVGVRPGHIPGAVNIDQRVFRDDNDDFKSPAEIKSIFQQAGIDLQRPITVSCGAGILACIVVLAAELAGEGSLSVYDGSWEEWGSRPDLPAEMDPA